MPASLRLEIFPSDLTRTIDFYTTILGFNVLRHDGNYAFLQRDSIFLGAAQSDNPGTSTEMETWRRPRIGVEIVMEVDNLQTERDGIVEKGYSLDADIQRRPWGLSDFRLVDPDGHYIRFTTHSPTKDGTGSGE